MEHAMTFWKFMGETAVQNWITLISLITTVIVSICFFRRTNTINAKKDLNEMLFTLQRLAFEYPYLENITFTSNWDKLKKAYNNKTIKTDKEKDQCLRYEYYCEMLFNYISQCYDFYKTEKKMEQYVGFKDWVRFHKSWWYNSLEDHRNQDTYDKELCKIIDSWLK